MTKRNIGYSIFNIPNKTILQRLNLQYEFMFRLY